MRQTGRAAADHEDAFDAVVAETLPKDGLTNHPGRAEENHPHRVTLSEELLPNRADERRVTQLHENTWRLKKSENLFQMLGSCGGSTSFMKSPPPSPRHPSEWPSRWRR